MDRTIDIALSALLKRRHDIRACQYEAPPGHGYEACSCTCHEKDHATHAAIDREVGPNEDESCPLCKAEKLK